MKTKKLILTKVVAYYKDIAIKYQPLVFIQILNSQSLQDSFERVSIIHHKRNRPYKMIILSKDDINKMIDKIQSDIKIRNRLSESLNKKHRIIGYLNRFIDDWDKLPENLFYLSGN